MKSQAMNLLGETKDEMIARVCKERDDARAFVERIAAMSRWHENYRQAYEDVIFEARALTSPTPTTPKPLQDEDE